MISKMPKWEKIETQKCIPEIIDNKLGNMFISNKNREILEIKLACHLRNQTRQILEIKCHLKTQMRLILKIQNPLEKSNVTNFGNQNDNKNQKHFSSWSYTRYQYQRKESDSKFYLWYSLPMLLTSSIRHTALTLLSSGSHYNLGLTYISTHSSCQLMELH